MREIYPNETAALRRVRSTVVTDSRVVGVTNRPGKLIYFCPNELRELQTGDLIITLGELLADSVIRRRVLDGVNEARRAMGEDQVDEEALTSEEIDLSGVMSVTLELPISGSFDTLALHTRQKQVVAPGTKNLWHWKITPKEGTAGSKLQIIVHVLGFDANGDETLNENEPLSIEVRVKHHPLKALWLLLITDLKWLFGTFLIPIFTYFFGRWSKRSKGQDANGKQAS